MSIRKQIENKTNNQILRDINAKMGVFLVPDELADLKTYERLIYFIREGIANQEGVPLQDLQLASISIQRDPCSFADFIIYTLKD